MITMKRSLIEESYATEETVGTQTAVLERNSTRVRRFEDVMPESDSVSVDEERLRMQRNLNRLLNYDKVEEVSEVEEVVATEAVVDEVATLDEDIRPTSTTLQFGDGNGEKLLQELNASERVANKEKYALTSKGKLVVVLYSLVVAVLIALIAINTGVLAGLKTDYTASVEEANGLAARYEVLQDDIASISSNEYIIDQAENTLNMVRGA